MPNRLRTMPIILLIGMILTGCSKANPAPTPTTPAPNVLPTHTSQPMVATTTPAPTAGVTATQPFGDNGAGQIAFLSDREGKPAIYLMNADGSNQRRLAGSTPRAICLPPVWSPDGQRIAYMVVPNGLSDLHGPLEVWSVGLDGAAPLELSANVTDTLLAYPWIDPTWSPDGTRLAVAGLHPVAGTSDKRSLVTILRSDGSGVEQTFPLDWIAGGVDWASTGEHILIEDMSPDESVRAHNVHLLSLSNGEIRQVSRDLLSAAWSPDGMEIVVVPAQAGQVLMVKLDGTSRPVGPLPAGTTPERAVWSPDGTAIAIFGKTNNGQEANLFLVTVSTGQVRRIALTAESLDGLEYSPDGKQLLISTAHPGRSSYSSRWLRRSLWVYDLASAALTELTDGKGYDSHGAWAPAPTASIPPAAGAGGEFAFASNLDGDFEIWIANADGSNLRQLTNNTAIDLSPAWSSDGSRLAFVSNRDGNDEIYTINADGSDVRRLTETPDASESFPAWSPDGQFISFDSNRGGNWDVYIANRDGSNPRRLTEHPGEDWISSWSPDGSQIAFESKRDGNYEIYVVNVDGSNPQRLTHNRVQDGAPKWSPDGSQITFFSRRDGNPEIYIMDSDGNNPLRLTNRAGDDSFPAWSPDGAGLIFSSGNNQQAEIYLISADGSQLQPLTANGAQNWTPAWRPAPTITTTVTPAELAGAYLGQTPPGLEPQVFAPGIVSIPTMTDYAGSFSADGTEFYFTRGVGKQGHTIYATRLVNGVWTTPSPASFASQYDSSEPHVTLDNQTLYFAWFHPLPPGETSAEGFGIWAVDRTVAGWSEARYVGAGMFVSSDQDGQIYVTNTTTRSLNKATLTAGRFTNLEPIAPGVHPAIAPDGSYLIYDDGDGNLAVRFLQTDGSWSAPKSLSTQGIPASASIATISPDGKYLFYAYNHDLYWVSTAVIANLKK